MNVTFTRTGERRYRVSVEGPGIVSSLMEPAPGYDARLPHDMAHFVVENELRIAGGVFGQLVAAGGFASIFDSTDERTRRKVARRGKRLATTHRGDAMLSEKLVYLACRAWNKSLSMTPLDGVPTEDIRRVCREFDAVSAIWSKLAVGESMTLAWRGGAARIARRRQRVASSHSHLQRAG